MPFGLHLFLFSGIHMIFFLCVGMKLYCMESYIFSHNNVYVIGISLSEFERVTFYNVFSMQWEQITLLDYSLPLSFCFML